MLWVQRKVMRKMGDIRKWIHSIIVMKEFTEIIPRVLRTLCAQPSLGP